VLDLDELERLVEGDNAPFVTALLLYAPAILHDLKVLRELRARIKRPDPGIGSRATVSRWLGEAERRVRELESGPAKRDEPELSETRGE